MEIEVTIDDINYDRLAELLVPVLQRSHTFAGILPAGATTEFVKTWLATLSPERKEQLVVDLLNANRGKLISKADELFTAQGMPLRVTDARVSTGKKKK